MLPPSLYEQVINTALNRELSEISDAREAVTPIDKAESSKVLAQYLTDVVQKGLENLVDNGGDISTQISLTNQIVDLIQNTTPKADFEILGIDQPAEQLLALLREQAPGWLWAKRLPPRADRRPLSPRAAYSPGSSMSHRCARS